MKHLLTVLSFLVISGCASVSTTQRATSGLIGCAPHDIQVRYMSSEVNSSSWEASCNRKKFYCSTYYSNVSCKEAAAE